MGRPNGRRLEETPPTPNLIGCPLGAALSPLPRPPRVPPNPPISLPLPSARSAQRMISLQDAAATILSWSPKGPPNTLALRATRSISQSKRGLEKVCCHPEVSFNLGAGGHGGGGRPFKASLPLGWRGPGVKDGWAAERMGSWLRGVGSVGPGGGGQKGVDGIQTPRLDWGHPGTLWLPMHPYSTLWVPTHSYCSLWHPYSTLWVPMAPYASLRVPLGPYGSPWLPMHPYSSLWVPTARCGSLCIPTAPYTTL